MAIENPITSDDLTIDFTTLLDLSVSDRVQAAASDNKFAQALMASLTPIQMAKAFPDYYRKQLPDISNFILANRYLDEVGKGGFDQQGGGNYGDDKALYDGETAIPAGQNPTGVPEPRIEEMQAKLLEKGIDINKTYDAITNGLSADDPQVQFLKNMSADKLAAMGIEQFKDDDGKVMFRKAPELSDQEVSNKISGKFVAKENASEKQKAVIEFASRWNISPQAAAGVLKIESGVTSDIAGGASGNYHGVFQLQTEQIRGLTEKAGFGSLTPAQYRKLSVADQLKVMDEYYKQAGITPEFFTGDPKTDASKMWALQLAPGNAKKIDYNNPNSVISKTDQASTIEARNKLVTVGSAGSGSIAGGEEFLGDSFTRIEGNASPEQIAEFRNQQRKTQKEVFTRETFHQAAPTSIEYAQTSFDDRNQTIVNEYGYSAPVTGTMMHEGHGRTSEFGYGRGRLHAGVDIYSTDPETGKLRVGSNAPVTAPMDAKITMIMKDRGRAGNYIEIQDKNGNRHRFLHTDKNPALNPATGETWKVGESVTQGQTITNITGSGTKFDQKVKELGGDINAAVSYFDQTGWGSVNKPHLHYEVRDSRGKLLNPSTIFPEYSGENKENITFSNRNDKLKHLLVTGQITKDDYDKQMQNNPEVSAKQEYVKDTNLQNTPKNKKPLSIIEYSRPIEDAEAATTQTTASTPTQTAEPVTTENTLFIGDSIAQGLKDAAQGQGNTTVGRKPHEVLSDMEKMGAESFKGKKVVLSTGLSNNTQDLESVRKQMEFLKNAGADVQIAGMSNSREDLAPGNQQLQQLSSEYGYKFMGGFDAGKDKIHPTSYTKYAAKAAEAIQSAEATPTDDSSDIEKKNDLLEDNTDRMGIAPGKLIGNFKNDVPVEINGQKVPEELYNEVEKKKIEEGSHAAERDVSELTQTAEATPTAEAPEVIYDGKRELFQKPETAETPEVIYDGKKELFQGPAKGPETVEAPAAQTPKAEAPAPIKSTEDTPAPVQVTEAIPAPTEAPEKVRKFRTGGSPDVQDDENLSVFDEDGSLKWKMNSGEGIYVKPKDTEYADEKMDELAGRVDDIDEKTSTPEQNQPKAVPNRSVANKEKNWQQDTSTVTYSIGSQNRAFKRTKFQNEGFHFSRSAPNSTSS